MIGHVVNCRSAHEIWTTLGTLFHTRSKARILQIKGLLQSTKKGNLSIDEYLLKMKRFADTLLEAGDPVSDENLCLYILGGLGSEYESVVVALTNRSEQLTLQDLQFSLQTHEMRIQSLASSTIDSVQANLANLNMQNNNRGQWRGSRPYNRGGKSRSNGRSAGRGNRVTCQLCGKPGHSVLKCYHRFDISFQGPPPDESPPSNNPQSPQAYMSDAHSGETTTSDWFLDSGATNHLANNMQQLRDPVDYKGKAKVTVGNGHSIPIQSLGYQLLNTLLPDKSLLLKDVLHVPNITKNLLSISQFTKDNNVILEFDSQQCVIKDKRTRLVLLQGILTNGLYKLQQTSSPPSSLNKAPDHQLSALDRGPPQIYNMTTTSNPVHPTNDFASTWHRRLAHPSQQTLFKVLHKIRPDVKHSVSDVCDACQLGKMPRFSFKSSINETNSPF